MRYLGKLEWFLHIHITRDKDSRHLWLYQSSYIDKLIAKFKINMTKKQPESPITPGEFTRNTKQATP